MGYFMKKFKSIPVLFVLSMVLIVCAACQPPIEKYGHLISELRDNVYTALSENYTVNIITGKREEPFMMDGHACGAQDFTLITIDPKAGEHTYTYRVKLNDVEYSGEFLAHPFARTYSADITAMACDTEIELTVTVNGSSETLAVKSVKTEQMIASEKAIEIAEKKLRGGIDSFRVGGVLTCEIYVRLMANPIDNSGGYYWYVAFIGENQAIYAVLIEPVNMQVVAIRN